MVQFGNRKNKCQFNFFLLSSLIISACFLQSCSTNNNDKNNNTQQANTKADQPITTSTKSTLVAPAFNADSAYEYTRQQVAFGPRVPGTAAHEKCAEFIQRKFRQYNLTVQMQSGIAQTFDSKQFRIKNIIASYKPEATNRILICSHWDARPFADEDTVDPTKPIDAANDGAAGVAVMIEMARDIAQSQPAVGVDFICFDLEDYGDNGNADTWCLGSQYWSNNLHKPGYTAKYGILLDMVGAEHAVFPRESHSVEFASNIVNKIWNTASGIGYGDFFQNEVINFVGIDDHIWVNKAGVPCVDIIHYDKESHGFGKYHHTHSDNMQLISRTTLKAVGQTLNEVIYSEK